MTWAKRFGNSGDRVAEVVKRLKSLYFQKKLITVTTSSETYTDMAANCRARAISLVESSAALSMASELFSWPARSPLNWLSMLTFCVMLTDLLSLPPPTRRYVRRHEPRRQQRLRHRHGGQPAGRHQVRADR